MTTSNTSKLVVRNTIWAYLSYGSAKLLSFVTTIILARLLVPAEFGIMAYCTIVIAYLDLLNNAGVGHALVARRDKLEEAQNAAFWVSIATSVVLYGITWFTAPLVADFFHEPQVILLLRVLSINLLIVGLGNVPMAMMQRDLRFKALVLPGIVRNIVKAGVAISLALQGFGVWSLVIAEMINKVIDVSVPWILVRWHPTWAFDWHVLREMLGYGVNIVAVSFLGTIMTNIDYMVVGRVLGSVALGYYTIAYRIPELLIRSTMDTAMMVAFPVLSKLQTDASRLSRAYFGYLRYLAMFALPAAAGVSLLSPAFFHTFYTPEWEPSIIPMRLIALEIGIASIAYVPGIIYKSVNRPDLLTKLTSMKLLPVIAVLWFASRWGINGVAAGMVVLSVTSTAVDSIVVQRVIGFSFMEMLRVLAPIGAATIVMSLAVALTTMVVQSHTILDLIVPILVGVAVYLGAMAVFSRETLNEASAALRAAIARS